jgi:hypothetical protein
VSRRTCRALVVAAAGISLLARAERACALEVQVITVQAAEHGTSDEELVALRPRLRRLVGYRSYHVIHRESRHVDWRATEAFAIPGGPSMQVVPKGMRDRAVVMQVTLRNGTRTLVDTDLRLQNRGTMLFGLGEDARTGDGALIIMLRAEE